jgi:plastocyanin
VALCGRVNLKGKGKECELRTAKKLCALAALTALVVVGLAPMSAQAQNNLNVQVGAPFFESEIPGEGMRFYSPTIKVHQGDSVTFNFTGFHTATLLPANTDVHAWVADNVTGPGRSMSFVVEDPDDTALDPGGSPDTPSLKANNAAIFPSPNPLCGGTGNPCLYDGSDVVNSGVQVLVNPDNPVWSAQINAEVGDRVWVICLPHPHMRMRIEVVDNSEATSTQEEIDGYLASQSALDEDEATAIHNRLSSKQVKHKTPSGKTVWDAWVGYDTHTISLLAMYPRRLNIRRGQTVRYHFAQMVYEDHTATLPKDKALEVAGSSFEGGAACDLDGDGGSGPDEPPSQPPPLFCPGGPAQLELDVLPRFAYEQGDGTFGRTDYENSGVRGASTSPRNDSWDVKFNRTTGNTPHTYLCLIHPFMRGKVAVKPAHH